MNINGLAAIVTGGASGLGGATAQRLAKAGAKVTIFDLNEEAGEAAARDIGGTFVNVNVAGDASVSAGLDAAEAAHGVARILVNCAGIAPAIKTVGRENAATSAAISNTTKLAMMMSLRCQRMVGRWLMNQPGPESWFLLSITTDRPSCSGGIAGG